LAIVLVDNDSQDDSIERFREVIALEGWADSVELLILQQNGGFGWANNQAILRVLQREVPPEAVLLINPDARAQPGAIAALTNVLAHRADIAAVGSQLIDANGLLSGSSFRFPSVGREWTRGHGRTRLSRLFGIQPAVVELGTTEPVDWVTGASVLLRVEALRQVGLFDTGFFLYFEEVELMFRLRRHGWAIVHAPLSRVIHIEGASTGVQEGQLRASKAPPAYLLESRRRFFALRGGAAYAWLAAAAWLLGDLQLRLWRLITRKKPSDLTLQERSIMRRIGMWPRKTDTIPFITQWQDSIDSSPAWMSFE
jgi:GT2 family glycosyltransferase